jgi:elongation factor G
LFLAVEPKVKGEEEKISTGLHRLMEEDPSFVLVRNTETHQTLLGGQGEIQIGIITAKLKEKFSTEVVYVDQKIPYRETIKGTADVQGKHKKQSGGAGQYGDVHIKFSPSKEEFEFAEALFGGSIPKNYVPAVEKGLRESMEKGPLAGCKVVNVKAVLYDGSYHDVDSNEMAFKIAASLAFKKGIVEAKPCLLEPLMHVEIFVPDEYMGDVMGDMNKRRGKILGMEPQNGGIQKVMAEAPQAELFDYAVTLRSMTQARGTFTMNFDRYEELPAHMAEKIIAKHKASEEAGH